MLLFVTTLFSSKVLKAQDEPYITLLDTGKRWIEAMREEFGGFNFTEHWIGDTVTYNDTVYYGLYENSTVFEPAYLYEDTIARKVYGTVRFNYPKILLYDFSLQVGDSIILNDDWFWVDSVKYENILGKKRKIMYLYLSVWIEGIGSLACVLQNNRQPDIYNMGGTELNCCYLNEALLYQSYWANVYGCNFEYLTVNELKSENITLYPNPIINVSKLSFSNTQNNLIQLNVYNIIGRLIKKEQTRGSEFEIYNFDFNPGIYIYTLSQDNQTFYSNKLIMRIKG